jgi:hypothetical protein
MGFFKTPKIKIRAPQLLPPPPAPIVSTAEDVSPDPFVEIESARRKSIVRRSEGAQQLLTSNLSVASQTAINLTNKLLGE